MIGELVDDLNKELQYKISSASDVPFENVPRLVTFQTDGGNHSVYFLGIRLWSSKEEQTYDNLSLEQQLELNERENFESYLRRCIKNELDVLCQIDILNK